MVGMLLPECLEKDRRLGGRVSRSGAYPRLLVSERRRSRRHRVKNSNVVECEDCGCWCFGCRVEGKRREEEIASLVSLFLRRRGSGTETATLTLGPEGGCALLGGRWMQRRLTGKGRDRSEAMSEPGPLQQRFAPSAGQPIAPALLLPYPAVLKRSLKYPVHPKRPHFLAETSVKCEPSAVWSIQFIRAEALNTPFPKPRCRETSCRCDENEAIALFVYCVPRELPRGF
jgi:hypothetical protein